MPFDPPVATYRLQLHPSFPFASAVQVVPYLRQLGISHVYLSPIFAAAPGHEARPPRDDYKKRKAYDPARTAGLAGTAPAPAGEGAAARHDFKKRKPFDPAFKVAEGAMRPRKKKARKPA